jgi:NAD(P)-dependent dehydrogenase (short-subunit alcohol dehydrogenase family)|nr:SDR family NAD(P)-dependent oxidoreductase [uncultured Oscillibacter sp.]
MFDFQDQVVVVTGASGIGIGNVIARQFYAAGAKLAICSHNKERIHQAAEEISGQDTARMFAAEMDAGSVDSVRAFAEAVIQRYGRIDVWVNNAGIHFPKPSLEVTPDDWDNTVNVNLRGYFFGAQAAARVMVEQSGGCIVNIGSVNKAIVTVGETVYAATKAGISKMTENLAREWGPSGIRVNCVAPGSVPTLINRKQYSDLRVHQAMCDKLPLRRRGEVREIADGVLFLASSYASYITGQTLFIDGGLSIVCG